MPVVYDVGDLLFLQEVREALVKTSRAENKVRLACYQGQNLRQERACNSKRLPGWQAGWLWEAGRSVQAMPEHTLICLQPYRNESRCVGSAA